MGSSPNIPIVDFSSVSLTCDDPLESDVKKVSEELMSAFTSWGFVYLKHPGIEQEHIDRVFKVSRDFFSLPVDTKMACVGERGEMNRNQGFSGVATEVFERDKPADLKEAFNIINLGEESPDVYPSKEDAPLFAETLQGFYKVCAKLAKRLLYMLAVGLNLDDKEFFVKAHQNIGKNGCSTTLRTVYYPPVGDDVAAGQQRCGEHTDGGTLTLLFQDAPGLQVMNTQGQYVDAVQVRDAVLVNIADLLQRWTSDRLVSTKHRVLVPQEDLVKKRCRQSLPFFVVSDDDFLIECLDGNNKYDPITTMDYGRVFLNKFKY